MQEVVSKEKLTYEGMRKVLGGNGSGTPDRLALYAKSMGPPSMYSISLRRIFGPYWTQKQ
ncbi:hypothetical protein [Lysinibacillus sp. 3P01SB]|uniref:hypothetical protein n=1 Tax=Lysinibacillus sp. 3P01SB TaxID=3132284 RepID=UPI0039A63CBE